MVEREAQEHAIAVHELLVLDDDLVLNSTQAQYRAFGRVDQRSEELDSHLSQVADGERASRKLGGGEFSSAGPIGESHARGRRARGAIGLGRRESPGTIKPASVSTAMPMWILRQTWI